MNTIAVTTKGKVEGRAKPHRRGTTWYPVILEGQ